VKGTRGKAMMRFVSERKTRMGFVSIIQLSPIPLVGTTGVA
jgi:hypothetical protein